MWYGHGRTGRTGGYGPDVTVFLNADQRDPGVTAVGLTFNIQ